MNCCTDRSHGSDETGVMPDVDDAIASQVRAQACHRSTE